MNVREVEQMKEQIEGLSTLSIAMEYPFLKFVGEVNRAVGAANITQGYSPYAYVEAAEKSLKQIENAIKNYRESKLQDYEVAPKSNEDVASEYSVTMFGLGMK